MPRAFSFLFFGLSLTTLGAQHSPALSIDLRRSSTPVSPILYGLMTEEINYSYDGGLYAELMRNRALNDRTFTVDTFDPAHWNSVETGRARVAVSLDPHDGPSAALPKSLKIVVSDAASGSSAGVENEGFWGIPVRPSTAYRFSFYAKAEDASVGPVSIRLRNDDSGESLAQAVVAIGTTWKPYSLTLRSGTAARTSTRNHLQITLDSPGTFRIALVSLFPPTYHDRPNGNRFDLMEKLAAMKPAFLRFPGGNYLQGDQIADRFQWKKTIGPLVDRPTHPSPWNYHSSDGMGLLEFLEWCEDLHMRPVLAIYAGYSLAHVHVNPGADLAPFVDDALDEIEYVSGPATSRWGAVRAQNGHPEPFPLHYVEIGNEDQFDNSGSYPARYAQFYQAIKARYPALEIIATAPTPGARPDLIDDHFYRSANVFFNDTHHYDHADRGGPKIFVGEWATREGAPTPNFHAALGDAAWMTGLERNGDIVVMASYAPLFVNVNPGAMQWESDLIGYDALTSYGSPSYYAQVMFSNHLGTKVPPSTLTGARDRLFHSVTYDPARRTVFLKLVNAASTPQPIDISLDTPARPAKTAKLITLSARSPEETNSISDPKRIQPVESTIPIPGTHFSRNLPPYSIQVLELHIDGGATL